MPDGSEAPHPIRMFDESVNSSGIVEMAASVGACTSHCGTKTVFDGADPGPSPNEFAGATENV
jgi:hypothetical protein